MLQTLRIDIVSDVVCPWCIIGYQRLQAALVQLPEPPELEVHWHPFELNPGMGPEGQNLREHLMQKYGSTVEQSIAARQNLTRLGEGLGFRFNFFDDMRMVNTFQAHQLLHWAGEKGQQTQTALKLALFEAYFSQQQDVSQVPVLTQAAATAGLDPQEALDVLTDNRYAAPVRQAQDYWRAQNINAVPAYILNNRYLLNGAQDPETFLQVFQTLAKEAAE